MHVTPTWLAVALAFLVGILAGVILATPNYVPPVCEEDEVVLVNGTCNPLDDSNYIGGEGWIAR